MIEQSIEIGGRPDIPAITHLRNRYGPHYGCLRKGTMGLFSRAAGNHVNQARNVRVYIGLLKKTDPYRGSKTQRELRNLSKKDVTWPKPR